MFHKVKESPYEKPTLHPRNRNRAPYDFKNLFLQYPELAAFEKPNILGVTSIDFSNPAAMILFNRILLKKYYGIEYWELPANYLVPAIPGRADYIHLMADLLAESNEGNIPTGPQVKCLDIGTGASCIYPIIGIMEYGWSFVGTDIDAVALHNAERIIEQNPTLAGKLELRIQENSESIFQGIIKTGDQFDCTICNSPFHSSFEETQSKAWRKFNSLTQMENPKSDLIINGKSNELWCEGGEKKFLSQLISESKDFFHSSSWFSTLVSKKSNLDVVYAILEKVNAREMRTMPMMQGNKASRIVAWRF